MAYRWSQGQLFETVQDRNLVGDLAHLLKVWAGGDLSEYCRCHQRF